MLQVLLRTGALHWVAEEAEPVAVAEGIVPCYHSPSSCSVVEEGMWPFLMAFMDLTKSFWFHHSCLVYFETTVRSRDVIGLLCPIYASGLLSWCYGFD